MAEPLSEKQLQALYLRVVQEFKYKKLEIDKKLDEIVNKKIPQLEKKTIKNKKKEGFPYFNGAYTGEYNKDIMPNGNGAMIFAPSEDMFYGQFDSGLRHGMGKYTYFSGGGSAHHPFNIPYYAGEWFADSYHGLGKKLITDWEFLCCYEGTFTHNLQNGFATFKKFDKGNQKICNTELIGYFLNGQGYKLMIEINKDDDGNLSQDTPSGLFEFDLDKGTKTPMVIFNKIEEWESIKPKKMDKVLSDLTYQIYETYFNLDIFTKKFSDLKYEAKKDIIKLMFDLNKFFEIKNNHFVKLMENVNTFNKDINLADKNEKLIELKNKIKQAKKEFNEIKKKIK